jgi:adenylate cyclase
MASRIYGKISGKNIDINATDDTHTFFKRQIPAYSEAKRFTDRLAPEIEDLIARHYKVKEISSDLREKLRNTIRTISENIDEELATGEQREVTVLLSDLRGFTAITETYAAKNIVEMLNRYFSLMCRIIYSRGGIVDKFMGDSIMALFGAMKNREDDVIQAICCSIEMQIAMDLFNKESEILGMPNLYMGIGINTGQVVAGNIGSALHSEYTVIGNEVNLASRIEAYTLRGQILISKSTYRKANRFLTVKDPIHVSVKGKKDAVPLFEVVSVTEPYNLAVPEREVRRSLRADVNIPFTFRICEGKVICSTACKGRILNISAGGIYACTEVDVKPFLNLVFRINLFPTNMSSSDIYGKILRVTKLENTYEINIEFTLIAQEDRELIKNLVNRVIEGDFS